MFRGVRNESSLDLPVCLHCLVNSQLNFSHFDKLEIESVELSFCSIVVNDSNEFRIRNSLMRNSQDSALVITYIHSVFVSGSLFDGNTARIYHGGAMSIADVAAVVITASNFTSNVGYQHGGAVYIQETMFITVFDVCFINNSASTIGFHGLGGGIIVLGIGVTKPKCNGKLITHIVLKGSLLFDRNSASSAGGIFMKLVNASILGTQNCNFRNNFASRSNGGGILVDSSYDVVITSCHFQENSAKEGGGGLKAFRVAHLSIKNCSFLYNSANQGGATMIAYTKQLTLNGTIAHWS